MGKSYKSVAQCNFVKCSSVWKQEICLQEIRDPVVGFKTLVNATLFPTVLPSSHAHLLPSFSRINKNVIGCGRVRVTSVITGLEDSGSLVGFIYYSEMQSDNDSKAVEPDTDGRSLMNMCINPTEEHTMETYHYNVNVTQHV